MRIVIKESGIEYPATAAPLVNTPQSAADQLEDIADSDTETFCVILLDARKKMISAEIVTNGLVDCSLVHAREVYRSAVRKNACAVILAHNHPTGDASPSVEDIRITKQLIEAGKVLDIKVMDHIIVGKTTVSLREKGIVSFA